MPQFRSNELVLADLLGRVGLPSAWDEIRDCLRGLEAMATVTLSIEGSLMVVQLLRRGEEVASGRTAVDGVEPPGPDCPY
ncbi:MAG: hypothetical protein KA105_00670 [Caulobacter sp.]|nr:hypothetical protein [Caulobacter sp.]